MEFYKPCALDPDKHRRTEFSCGNATMDEWLRRYSGQNRRGNNAATWVIADREYRVVSYATLSMTSIDRSACPKPLTKNAPAKIPALLVGRLATDQSVAGLGLGTQMVLFILGAALDLNHTAAFRAVVVNALNVDAYAWWQRFGFVPLNPENDASMDLYLLTADIAETVETPTTA